MDVCANPLVRRRRFVSITPPPDCSRIAPNDLLNQSSSSVVLELDHSDIAMVTEQDIKHTYENVALTQTPEIRVDQPEPEVKGQYIDFVEEQSEQSTSSRTDDLESSL